MPVSTDPSFGALARRARGLLLLDGVTRASPLRELVVLLLRVYQLTLSPLLGPVCRFAPSCSSYAVTAVRRYGVLHGAWLTARRLARCHPWNDGGWDPVPERPHEHSTTTS